MTPLACVPSIPVWPTPGAVVKLEMKDATRIQAHTQKPKSWAVPFPPEERRVPAQKPRLLPSWRVTPWYSWQLGLQALGTAGAGWMEKSGATLAAVPSLAPGTGFPLLPVTFSFSLGSPVGRCREEQVSASSLRAEGRREGRWAGAL